MESITLNVKGMTCGHCEASVKGALKEVGAEDVKVDLGTGKVDVSYNKENVTLDKMKEAVEEQGYDVA